VRKLLIAALLLTNIALPSVFAKDAPQNTDLPKVLIIGDSISIGYTPHVARILKGKATVKHNKGNAGHSGMGLKNLDKWIGTTNWDVIHFNWGLWDLCYRHPKSKVQGKRDRVNGKVTHTVEQYEENLDKLVARLKKTDAKLIWAHTTVVPEKEAGRIVGDDKKYNDVATKIMKKHGVAINDLYTLSKSFPSDHFKKPGDVHYTVDGYKELAKLVADILSTTIEGQQTN
jgi:lysophospholipase L1-like esterase